jgi:hypothetical protein
MIAVALAVLLRPALPLFEAPLLLASAALRLHRVPFLRARGRFNRRPAQGYGDRDGGEAEAALQLRPRVGKNVLQGARAAASAVPAAPPSAATSPAKVAAATTACTRPFTVIHEGGQRRQRIRAVNDVAVPALPHTALAGDLRTGNGSAVKRSFIASLSIAHVLCCGRRIAWSSEIVEPSRAPTRGGMPKEEKKCPHGRRQYYCKECGGAGICVHGRERKVCKVEGCGGASICAHGRKRGMCKVEGCGGASICAHGREPRRAA